MIAIIGAMEEEVLEITKLIENQSKKTIKDVDFIEGSLNNKAVVVFLSGIGLTNAALRLTLALDHFEIDGVVNIGTAGGIGNEVQVLDVIISTKVAYHEFDISVFGNPRSFSDDNRFCYKADSNYIELAQTLIKDRTLIGPMVSGNQFISEVKQIESIEKYYPEALCADMEAAAIAHVSSFFNCPFIILRSISDHVKHPDNNLSFEAYLQKASKRSAEFVYNFVGAL